MTTFLERIQQSAPRQPVAVATPEWGECDGLVYVRRLSAIDRAKLYDAVEQHKATRGARFHAFVVAYCACDPAGTRLFDDAAGEQLEHEPCTVIERISEAADDLNLISDAARERVKKASATCLGSGCTSASPAKPESA